MNSFWHKVCADLSEHKSRSLLATGSLAIGLFTVGTLLGMMDLQLSSMDKSHKLSQPSHINLILKTDADLTFAEQIKAIPNVENVDTLTQFTVRFKTPTDSHWQIGTAIFRPDYSLQQYDLLRLQAGRWPDKGAIAVERLSAKSSQLKLDDSVTLETDQGEKAFTIAGIIRHPFVKPPAFGGQAHFFIGPESAGEFGIPDNTFRQLLLQVKAPYSEDKARKVAGDVRAKLAALGVGVNASLLQNPDKHWGRPFFSGINLILTVMAWASLGLSAVLTLNTVAALITQQTDQIGIMKAIGARFSTIASIYLIIVLVLAVLAIAVAIPLSQIVAYYASRWFLDLFNIELNRFEYSLRAVSLMLVGGLLAPILAALWPIWRGASMSVRQAIASFGLGADFNSNWLDIRLDTKIFNKLPTLYAVSLGNLFRRKSRLLWTQSVLIIAGVLFIIIISLIKSVNLTLDNELARSQFTVRLGFARDQPTQLIEDIVRDIPKTEGVEFWNRLPAELTKNGQLLKHSGSLGAQMIALPADTNLYQPLIVAGRWLQASDNNQRALVLNAETAERNGIKPGDTIEVKLLGGNIADWQVVGLYRWFVGSGYSVEPVYVPLATSQALTKRTEDSSFALLAAKVKTVAEEKQYADTIKDKLQAQHIKLDFYTTVAKLEQRQHAKNQFRPITSMLLGLAFLIAVVGALGLTGTLAIGVLQRTREIGVYRAIGANSSSVFTLFMLEGFLHGLIAWLTCIPIAYLLAEPLAKKLGELMLGIQLDFSFSFAAVWIWLGLISVLVQIAAYFPARNATLLVVRSSLSY